MSDTRPILLVSGNPRSGTTALTRLLNLHPDVAIGMERFSRQVMREKTLLRSFFEPERFCTHDEKDCHQISFDRPENVTARAKIATAKVVGDKTPDIASVVRIVGTLTDLMVVFIVREPLGVAYSYQMRTESALADPEADPGWNTSRTYVKAVVEFNRNISRLAAFLDRFSSDEALKSNAKVHVVHWEELFFGDQAGVEGLFEFANVRPLTKTELAGVMKEAENLPTRPRRPEIDQHVALFADYQNYRRVKQFDQIAA